MDIKNQSRVERIKGAASRALEEAEARRKQKQHISVHQKEIGGREGPEPTRFGDWELKGIISDF
jgi:Uncharacterized conserved small protein